MYALTIAFSVLLSILPANLAQDPMPTPIPTPLPASGNRPCYWGSIWPNPLPKENDTSIKVYAVAGFFEDQPVYAFECLSQGPDCQITDQILGYAPVEFHGKIGSFAIISLTRSLQRDEYLVLYVNNANLYAPPSPYFACSWNVYGVFSPRFYLPLVVR